MSAAVVTCGFCGAGGHTHSGRRGGAGCPLFTRLKRATTSSSYCNEAARAGGALLPADIAGFAAAGVLPWRSVNGAASVLMAFETRGGNTRYNFLGGKRDAQAETPVATATRELREEALGHISVDFDSLRWVIWSAADRYVIHVPTDPVDPAAAEAFESRWCDEPERPNDISLKAIRWVRVADLLRNEFLDASVHHYVHATVGLLRRMGVWAALERDARHWRRQRNMQAVTAPAAAACDPLPAAAACDPLPAATPPAARTAPGAPPAARAPRRRRRKSGIAIDPPDSPPTEPRAGLRHTLSGDL